MEIILKIIIIGDSMKDLLGLSDDDGDDFTVSKTPTKPPIASKPKEPEKKGKKSIF